MTKEECDQVARIINEVFACEESVNPTTIASMFELMGRMAYFTKKEELEND